MKIRQIANFDLMFSMNFSIAAASVAAASVAAERFLLVPEGRRILAGGESTGCNPENPPAPEGRQTMLGLSPLRGWDKSLYAPPVVTLGLHHRLMSAGASGAKNR